MRPSSKLRFDINIYRIQLRGWKNRPQEFKIIFQKNKLEGKNGYLGTLSLASASSGRIIIIQHEDVEFNLIYCIQINVET